MLLQSPGSMCATAEPPATSTVCLSLSLPPGQAFETLRLPKLSTLSHEI